MEDYKNTNWWNYLDEPMKDLVQQSYTLLEGFRIQNSRSNYHDYSFIVFPMAKAYEGFLKKVFLDLKFINTRQYRGDRFRIGRALNPNLPKRYRWDWVWGKMVTFCGGEELPTQMWEVWKKARNRIFHYFPEHQEFVTLAGASELVAEITRIMEKILVGCRLAKT